MELIRDRTGDLALPHNQTVQHARASGSLELEIIVPTFNERENVIEVIRRLGDVLAGIEYEVIVVDDDSPDGTSEAVRDVARSDRPVRVLQRIDRRGLSSACVEGLLATAAPYVAVMDADLQHDERLLPAMLSKLKSESLDLVVATRHVEGGSTDGFSSWRVRLSDAGKRLSRIVTCCPISDPMSGFFLVDRRSLNEVAGHSPIEPHVARGRPIHLTEVAMRISNTNVRNNRKL